MKPFFLDNETPIPYDVDDTLIIWDDECHKGPQEGRTEIICPYDGAITHHLLHKRHISLLKKHKSRGKGIVVWSAAGAAWANVVVQTLDLEEYVDVIMCKPGTYVDDLDVSEWMGNRVYLGPLKID